VFLGHSAAAGVHFFCCPKETNQRKCTLSQESLNSRASANSLRSNNARAIPKIERFLNAIKGAWHRGEIERAGKICFFLAVEGKRQNLRPIIQSSLPL